MSHYTESGDQYPLGWIPPEDRTHQMEIAHEDSVSGMIPFSIDYNHPKSDSSFNDDSEKVDLTELWEHPDVVTALGHAFPGIHQYTGSCVGAGGGNAIFSTSIVEVIKQHDLEEILIPFWLIPYGRSRFYAGMRGPGEGSLGSTFAKAVKDDGVLPANLPEFPAYKFDDGVSWYAQAERKWSDGSKIPSEVLNRSKKHPIKSTAVMNSADDCEVAIRNLYSITIACSLIPNPKTEDDGESYGRVARAGGHQTTLLAVWRHPRKGKRFFKYMNQWGLRWGKKGATWIPEEDVEAMIRNGRETYAFSQFQGFPAQRINWRF